MSKMIKSQDSWTTKVFVDPLAIPISKYLAKTFITPNQLTTISIIIAIFSSIFFVKNLKYIGIALFYISFLIDCLDGKIARLKNMSSEFGKKYDLYGDKFKKILIIISLLYSHFYLQKQLLIGIILVFIHYINHFLKVNLKNKFNIKKHLYNNKISKWLIDKNFSPNLFTEIDEQFFIFVILLLVSNFKFSLIVGNIVYFSFNIIPILIKEYFN